MKENIIKTLKELFKEYEEYEVKNRVFIDEEPEFSLERFMFWLEVKKEI